MNVSCILSSMTRAYEWIIAQMNLLRWYHWQFLHMIQFWWMWTPEWDQQKHHSVKFQGWNSVSPQSVLQSANWRPQACTGYPMESRWWMTRTERAMWSSLTCCLKRGLLQHLPWKRSGLYLTRESTLPKAECNALNRVRASSELVRYFNVSGSKQSRQRPKHSIDQHILAQDFSLSVDLECPYSLSYAWSSTSLPKLCLVNGRLN